MLRKLVTAAEVMLAYKVMLDRCLTEKEVAEVVCRRITLKSLLNEIWSSEEFIRHNAEELADDENIRDLFYTLLGRNPTEQELSNIKNSNMTKKSVLMNLWNSIEYKERENKLKCFTFPDDEIISTLYQALLRRRCSEEEISLYKTAEKNIWEILIILIQSEEYKRVNTASKEQVKYIYRVFLQREPSEDEINIYTDGYANLLDVLKSVLRSEEYVEKQPVAKGEAPVSSEDMEEIFDFTLGRPPRDYEQLLFAKESPIQLFAALRQSEEYKERVNKRMWKETMTPHFGAVTYRILWDEPRSFTCVYNESFCDSITLELRKRRDGIWQVQYELFKHFPKKGFFVDIGANIGVMSCMYASKGWDGFSIEASLRNVECLTKAVKLNDLGIQIGQFAVSDRTEELRFLENGPWGAIDTGISEENLSDKAYSNVISCNVQAYALDDWKKTSMNYITQVDYIKLDIEGAEVKAIKGMGDFLKEFGYPPIFCESNGEALSHFGYTTLDLKHELEHLGYRRYEWKDDKLYHSSMDKFQLEYCTDFLYLKDIPEFLSHLIAGVIQVKAETEQIRSLLNDNIKGPIVHVCSELRNFKEYLNDEEILRILVEKKKSNEDDLKTALNWFEI